LSNIRTGTISGVNGTDPVTLTKQMATKVWCNFNGQNTVTIRDSFNSTSVTDFGTGTYEVNYTSNMANVNYSVTQGSADTGYGAKLDLDVHAYQTTAKSRQRSFQVFGSSYASYDSTMMNSNVVGDLA
jgi:hypothetical protein